MPIDYDEMLQHISVLIPENPCNCEESEVLKLWIGRMTDILNRDIAGEVNSIISQIASGDVDREEACLLLYHIESVATKMAGITKLIMGMIEMNGDRANF